MWCTGRKQVESKLLALNNNGVPRIRSARTASDNIEFLRKLIDLYA